MLLRSFYFDSMNVRTFVGDVLCVLLYFGCLIGPFGTDAMVHAVNSLID